MRITSFLSVIAVAASLLASRAQAQPEARILSIQVLEATIVVEVQASGDLVKVLLESSTRVGKRAWEPRAVKHLDPSEEPRTFTFSLPITPDMEILRVRAENNPAVPSSFHEGPSEFVSGAGSGLATPGLDAGAPGFEDGRDTGSDRAVVESDIYKLSGDTLFFFNQYRGLQVIDVSDPDVPIVTGTYDIAAAGEQMYLMDGNQVVLLARDNCSWYGGSSESKIVLLEVVNGVPELVKELPVAGYIMESRLVGTALYVVANSYQRRTAPSGETWTWGSSIVSFDLSDFDSAQQKSSEWIAGYGNVIYATDEFLFVSHNVYEDNGYSSRIYINDISDPSGSIVPTSSISVSGNVQDKFKMNLKDDIFSVVTFDWRNNRPTVVRTFSLADPSTPSPLGSLKIIENEQLHATRFHGDTLYAVTFFVIDPLWVIDLSDPANPKKTGELEIPGWSTYLQPIGDKLVAIGLDQEDGERRTAVQLFDVSDPTNPFLASKVLIGDKWSGSEANWDEKAFGVLPEENLVLVPFYSYGEAGAVNGVQLIDLLENSLVKRGVIEHEFGARRATVHRDRILSLSTRELLTVDASDRDNPEVTAETVLSWAADRVHLTGEYLIEVDGTTEPRLRVVAADDPSELFETLVLTNLPYLGSVIHDGTLYVLQGRGAQVVWPDVYDPENWRPTRTNEGVLVCTEFALDGLPELSAGRTATAGTTLDFYFAQMEGLSVDDDLIVWASSSGGYGYPWYFYGPGVAVDALAAPIDRIAPWYGGASGLFIPVAVGDQFRFGKEVRVSSDENAWWNFGEAFTADGLVYTSHLASEYDPTFDPPPYTYDTYRDGKLVTITNDPPAGSWLQRYYLNVIDFADQDEPLVRKPVSIPGSLIGLDRGGELLFTKGYAHNMTAYDEGEILSACAYDGLSATLVHSIQLPREWPRAVHVHDGNVYVGDAPPAESDRVPAIRILTVPGTGEFTEIGRIPIAEPPQQLENFGDLLVAQAGRIYLFDVTEPASAEAVGSGSANTCYGLRISKGDGAVDRGIWLPMGWYGVVYVPTESKSE